MSRPGPSNNNNNNNNNPLSFKTVPGRNKTQKWSQAKTYNYDGDDWGGYDPYDEYGGYDDPPPGPANAPQQPQSQQSAYGQPARRQNSFDGGLDNERRAFSAGYTPPPPQPPPHVVERRASPSSSTGRVSHESGRPSGEYGAKRLREFSNPGQVPAPLSMRGAAPPATIAERPPRKSSLSAASSASEAEPTAPPKTEKPLPFIRPSDIYKRMNEEKERERKSQESSRPSMDSIQRDAGSPPPIPAQLVSRQSEDTHAAVFDIRPSLPPVNETSEPQVQPQGPLNMSPASERSVGNDRAFTGFRVDNPVLANALGAGLAPSSAAQSIEGPQGDALEREDSRPKLPPVSRISGFGNLGTDFLRSVDDDDERSPPSGRATSTVATDPAPSYASQSLPPDATAMPATRAPTGQDPAAEILAERQHGHHVASLGRAAHEDPSGLTSAAAPGRTYDPAADILAERQHQAPVQQVGREAYEDPSGLTSQSTGATYDPASDILAERQHGAASQAVGRVEDEHAGGLSHQPSAGFRSVVHAAFDRQDDDSVFAASISRENSQTVGTAGVNRSDTNSTSSISPIMSRVPSAATAQQKQRDRDAIPPAIAEEPISPAPGSRVVSDATTIRASSPGQGLARKPAPGHSRNVSSEFPGFEPGYRRSLNTPSPNNSPARTPNVEDTSSRRLSGPLTAQTLSAAEAPDIPPEAPEMPSVSLRPAETPSASRPVSGIEDINTAIPVMTRGRSGTDYSLREADLAQYASSSPDKSTTSPIISEAAAFNQEQFLRTHPSAPTSPSLASPSSPVAIGTGFSRAGHAIPRATTPGSGRNSPVTSGGSSSRRVKAIVDQYHQIDDASRRNSAVSVASSKSSWSNFKGSTEDLPGLKRKMTSGSNLAPERSESPIDETDAALGPGPTSADSPTRPEASRLESFRPHLPGEWVSYAPTPAMEEPPVYSSVALQEPSTTRASNDFGPASPPTPRGAQFSDPDEEVDLTPTTKKTPLRFSDPAANTGDESVSALASVRSAGDALGAALMTSIGSGHQTRDFAAPKEESAAPVDVPELRPHRLTGDMYGHNIPILQRNDSEAPSFATASAASSVPPTPPAKDTPLPETGAARNLEPGPAGRPISSYFSGAEPAPPAPLKFTRHSPNTSADSSGEPRPKYLPSLSTDTHASDLESDRLRKDIVRTLGADKKEEIQRESILEDTEMTEDALDAPSNADRVAAGGSALSAAETKPVDARFALPSRAAQSPPQSTSGYQLSNRFSWEHKPQAGALYAPMAAVGELQGDEDRASYERPRSSQGLHVINTNVTSDSEPSTAATPAVVAPPTLTVNEPAEAEGTAATDFAAHDKGPVSPITKSQENLNLAASRSVEGGGLSEVAPSPISDSRSFEQSESHIPSYYAGVTDAPPHADAVTDPAPTVPDAIAPSSSSTAAAKPSSSTRVPPFREILAIKNTPDRIRAYADTRTSFADMNTGLNDWVSRMLTQHPEHADLAKQGPNTPMNTLPRTGTAHKHSPSILKITKQFTSHDASSSGSPLAAAGEGRKVSNPPASSSTGGEGLAGKVDVKEMQAKGKDLMKSAGAGAKGLFAKGRSRFANRGGEKAPSASPSSPHSSSTAVPKSPKSSRSPTVAVIARPGDALPPPTSRFSTFAPVEHGVKGASTAEPLVEAPMSAVDVPKSAVEAPVSATDVPKSGIAVGQINVLSTDGPEAEAAPTLPLADEPANASTSIVQSSEREFPAPAITNSSDTPTRSAPAVSTTTTTPMNPTSVPLPTNPTSPSTDTRRPSFFQRLRSASRSASRSMSRSRPTSLVLADSAFDLGKASSDRATSRSRSRPTSVVFNSRSLVPAPVDDVPPITDEMRRKSEERSRSRSRSRSRPRSASIKGAELWNASRADATVPAMPTNRSEVWAVSAEPRKEAWEESDEVPSKSVDDVEGMSVRLGVLPSPATDGLSIAGSPSKVRDGGEVVEKVEKDVVAEVRNIGAPGNGADEAPVNDGPCEVQGEMGSQLGSADQPTMFPTPPATTPLVIPRTPKASSAAQPASFSSPPPAPGSMHTPTRPQTPLGRLSEEAQQFDSPTSTAFMTANSTPARPLQERKFSARDFLPSQQRNRQASRPGSASGTPIASPRRQSLADDELYSSTPVATKAPWRDAEDDVFAAGGSQRLAQALSGQRTPNEVDAAAGAATRPDEDESGTRPDAVTAPRPGTADTWDKQSMVSAQEEPTVDTPDGKADDAISRRSSVSSIGNVDASIAPPIVFKRQSAIVIPEKRMSTADAIAAADSTAMATGEVSPLVTTALLPIAFAQQPQALDVAESGSAAKEPMAGRPLPDQDLSPQHTFADRSYQKDLAGDQRPMSYMPLPRNPSGAPAQETFNTGSNDEPTFVDLSAFAGPPPGAPPYSQHPAHRGSKSRPPSEYEKLRISSAPSSDPTMTATAAPGDRTSKRFSFFRNSEQVSAGASGSMPPPSQINDQYGIEDAQISQMASEMARNDQTDKQAKRRSGIWNSFKRSPSTSLSGYSRPTSSQGSPANTPGILSRDDGSTMRPNTLKKPQRSSSSAVEPTETKKRRFSRLGSLFGRSNTQTAATSKANRLTKVQPPDQDGTQRYQPSSAGAVAGSARGYEAYEDMRKRQTPPSQQHGQQYGPPPQQPQPYVEPMMSSPYQQRPPSKPYSRRSSLVHSQSAYPPRSNEPCGSTGAQDLTGYQDSDSQNLSPGPGPGQPMSSPMSGQPGHPGTRRLHSSGYQHPDRLADVPEPFRPVESSYNRTVSPIGPPVDPQSEPPHGQPVQVVPHSRQSSIGSVVHSPAAPQATIQYPYQSQTSYGNDNFPQAPGRQDYQTQYWRQQQQPTQGQRTMSPVSPIQISTIPVSHQDDRTAGMDEQMARSPAKDYVEQQTPWSINMPEGANGLIPDSREDSWTIQPSRQPYQQHRFSPPRAARGAVSSPRPHSGYQEQYDGPMGIYSPISPQQQRDFLPRSPQQGPGYYEQQPRDVRYNEESYHNSPPYTPAFPQWKSGYYDAPRQHPSQPRYHRAHSGGPPGQFPHQRTASGDGYEAARDHQRAPSGGGYSRVPQDIQQPKTRYYNLGEGGGPLVPGEGQRQLIADEEGRPLTYQRTSSGYTGRRDDAAVNEAELMGMRGASYPGQEWMPPRT